MKKFDPVVFYLDALENAPYPVGILYLARHIMRDFALTSVQRSYLMVVAKEIYGCINNQRDIFLDL